MEGTAGNIVDFEVILKIDKATGKPYLEMPGMAVILDHMAETYQLYLSKKPLRLQASVRPQKKIFKSRPQLGYLYGHLAHVLLEFLNESGWPIYDKDMAVEFIKPDLGFVECYRNPKTDQETFRALSVATAPIQRVYKFIDDLFIFLVQHGCSVITAEEYKRRKKWQARQQGQ